MNTRQKLALERIRHFSDVKKSHDGRGALVDTIRYHLMDTLRLVVPVPGPSVRRIVGELRSKGYNILSNRVDGEVYYKLA